MNISPNNEKIQKYLDELSNEYKELLFVALLERSKSIDDISISDLLRIDNEIKKPLLTGYQKQQRLRRLIISSGIIYIFSGIGTLLFYEIIENGFYSTMNRILSHDDGFDIYKEDALVYKYKIERIKAYDKIVRNNSSQSKFFLGWVRRVLED